MKRRLLLTCALVALAGPAAADPKVQVLQSEGRADAKVRAKIDASVLALAKAGGGQVIPGDITFGEAAAAVGCKPEEAACRDEVLGMLSVDEIVITTVTPKPGGFEVAVRRASRGGASRDATSFVAYDKLDKLETIAPLFSTRSTPAPAPAPVPAPAPPPSTTTRVYGPLPAPSPPSSTAITTTSPRPPSEIAPAPPATEPRPIATELNELPARKDEPPRGRRRLQKAGMIGGGTMLALGFVFWGSAASVQSDIDSAPAGTKDQLRALQDLEAKGDTYAGLGNLFVVGGLVIGGISTYFFVKSGRRRPTSARLVPTLFDRGGGLAIAIGGTP